MTDKNTKKEIKKIIRKYIGSPRKDMFKAGGSVSGSAIVLGMGLDFALTGGLFTGAGTALISAGGAVGIVLPTMMLTDNPQTAKENTARQALQGKSYVHQTLKTMESKLHDSFNLASLPQGDAPKKITVEIFQSLAAEIEQDAQKLSPAFRIVSGGPNGFGTEKYEFIVAERNPSAGKKELVTLAQALQELTAPTPPSSKRQNPPGGLNL